MKYSFKVRLGLVGLVLSALAAGMHTSAAPMVRVKDLSNVEGVRSNPLIGYGLVVGLQGTGDGTQAKFTFQSIANMLNRSGVAIDPRSVRVKNVAAVMVTASLPPFVRQGQTLDVQVSSLGDAKSLQGGTLLMTPLSGPDGKIYAVAQGSVSIGGAFLGGSGGNSVQKNHPTAGRVPAGAIVERTVPMDLAANTEFRLLLDNPDFETANRMAGAINDSFGSTVAHAIDPVAIEITLAEGFQGRPVAMLAKVQAVEVRPDIIAKVVINEKTGTVVMGANVRISAIALAHGNLEIEISTEQFASQPAPFSRRGDTKVLEDVQTYAAEGPSKVLSLKDGVSVGEVVSSLNAMGVTPRDMIAIFQAMKAAGALYAELEIL